MNTKIKSIFKTIALSLGALLIVTGITYATSTLIPQGTPGSDTQYTLNDIYAKLVDFTDGATGGTGLFTTPGTVSPTFRTLSEIYALLEAEDADLVPENILDGVTIFGVEGTVVEEVVLELSTEAIAELCWDTNQGCSEGAGLLNGEGAIEYCTNLTEGGHTNWRLPEIDEATSEVLNDWVLENGYGGGDDFVENTNYWSNTEYSPGVSWEYGWVSGSLYADYNASQNGLKGVICVRNI